MKVSLIMSTLGRFDEVMSFIAALEHVDHDDDLELIIVDQNADGRLRQACAALKPGFTLHHIEASQVRGLSRGRNMGIAKASGDILGFPDDDCIYPPGLLTRVLQRFEQTGAGIVCGRAATPEGRSINGRFETTAQAVGLHNVFTTQIEWVVFFRREVLELVRGYDEGIGVGAQTPWQSCEGPDITIRAIRAGVQVHYDPQIYAHHAELDTRNPDAAMRAKGRRYARGMGHVMRKHRYGLLFLANYLARPAAGAGLSLLQGNLDRCGYYLQVAVGRAEGYAGACLDGSAPRAGTQGALRS